MLIVAPEIKALSLLSTALAFHYLLIIVPFSIRGLLEKYPTFGREKETGLPGALDT